jgi:hypothetical protein
MSITRSRTPIENRYSLKGHILEDIKEAKYLGTQLWLRIPKGISGDHTVEQYSKFNLTITLYAFSFVDESQSHDVL